MAGRNRRGESPSGLLSREGDSPSERILENRLLGFAGFDRFRRALFGTGSTVGAESRIDYILVISLADCARGAHILTGTASQTFIGNHVRHNFISFLI